MRKQNEQPYGSFDSFERFFAQTEQRPGYWVELAKLDFTREVLDRMKQLDVTKGQLAVKLDAQPALVTRLLSGKNNFELATMVRIARALDCEFRSHLQPKGTQAMWIDVLHEEPERAPVPVWNPDEFKSRKINFDQQVLSNESLPVAA
jgi:transcriptional regulator with XRE-family HTH domain